ncbi:DUF1254 domain-containing protein [Pseudomonas sp. BJa5]|uniref:DUF1254 domain-containing protein n=1 Tax=Pseudomonas sp. BJa5 TaxID=2936270 RepID=UPI00255A2E6E|nr:DUF1254 domain-containing protein [Pseudomonas sp. BGr12]MDL2424011.1 DUF1254 domain-containing protein [Pseudomonas sp. BGr12]
MKLLSAALLLTSGTWSLPGMAAQVASPTSDITLPASGIQMHPEYAKAIARMAYLWGWPMVNMLNRNDTITKAPHPGLLGGILPVAPRGQLGMLHDYITPQETFVTCPNQDVVYGLGFFSLDEEPVIAQVPDFGERFWVYSLYDQRTDQFGQLGKAYNSKPGFYLLVGPNWQGEKPAGVEAIIHSPTALANAIPRIFMDDTAEDRSAIQDTINQVVFYPLKDFDGKMKTIDWKNTPDIPNPNAGKASGGETKWVIPEKFFDQLPRVLDMVPPLPGEEALYGQFRLLLESAEKDPALKKLLVQTAVQSEQEIIKPFFEWKHNGRPAGNGWNRSTNNARFGLDYFNRTGTAKSNMFDNRPNETQYFYTDFDGAGKQLNGNNRYEVTFAAGQEPPVQGFWSLTLYNRHHLFSANTLNRYSLGTKNKDLKRNADGSLTLYVGPNSPGKDKESNWLPSPREPISLYLRAYWGSQAILDGSWQPPVIKRIR